jgi:hypothetical protein
LPDNFGVIFRSHLGEEVRRDPKLFEFNMIIALASLIGF